MDVRLLRHVSTGSRCSEGINIRNDLTPWSSSKESLAPGSPLQHFRRNVSATCLWQPGVLDDPLDLLVVRLFGTSTRDTRVRAPFLLALLGGLSLHGAELLLTGYLFGPVSGQSSSRPPRAAHQYRARDQKPLTCCRYSDVENDMKQQRVDW